MTTPEEKTEKQAAALASLLKKVFEDMKTPAFFDREKMMAMLKWARYVELVGAGFSQAQALILIRYEQ